MQRFAARAVIALVIDPLAWVSHKLGRFGDAWNEALLLEIFSRPDDSEATQTPWTTRWLRTVYRHAQAGSECRSPAPSEGLE